ncbi:MAG: hypothetical protein KGY39_07870 [Anaerolineales bacterium]|nr:hypothetical protein [Anaerolineales bacterium]MBS3753274.1 hypothetical protein [Anaerolineales bacterium]
MKKQTGKLFFIAALVIFSSFILTGCIMDQFARMFNDCCFSPAMILPFGFLALAIYQKYTL